MSATIYYSFLVLHVIGFTLMAGTSFIDLITFRAFRKAIQTDPQTGLMFEIYLYKLQRFIGIGMLLILISGIGMMIRLHEVWGIQWWFRIKMGVLLLIIINGLGIRRMLGTSVKKLSAKTSGIDPGDNNWKALSNKFNSVQIVQLLLFICIFILSVFKFN